MKKQNRAVRIVSIVMVAILLGLLIPFAKDEFTVYRAQTRFEENTDEMRLAGNTVEQVKGLLGNPRETVNYDGESCDMIYAGPYEDFCRVEVREGHVEHVKHWSK
jgi:hypothetical protein